MVVYHFFKCRNYSEKELQLLLNRVQKKPAKLDALRDNGTLDVWNSTLAARIVSGLVVPLSWIVQIAIMMATIQFVIHNSSPCSPDDTSLFCNLDNATLDKLPVIYQILAIILVIVMLEFLDRLSSVIWSQLREHTREPQSVFSQFIRGCSMCLGYVPHTANPVYQQVQNHKQAQLSPSLAYSSPEGVQQRAHQILQESQREIHTATQHDENFSSFLETVVRSLGVLFLFVIAVSSLGVIDTWPLYIGLGFLAASLSLGSDLMVRNLLGTWMCFMNDTHKVDEIVTVNGIEGRVKEIGLLVTTIRSYDGNLRIVPNKWFTENVSTVWRKEDMKCQGFLYTFPGTLLASLSMTSSHIAMMRSGTTQKLILHKVTCTILKTPGRQ